MSRVVVDISVSLDGYVTGPNVSLDNGLGDNGESLHVWAINGSAEDNAVLDAAFDATGAVVQGRNLFDIIDGPDGWNDEMGYGAKPTGEVNPPVFVVTHTPPEKTRLGDRFRFVGSPSEAVTRGREVAGSKDVYVMGGGQICYEVLAAGLADVLRLHLAPVVLGNGTRLFPADAAPTYALQLIEAVSTPNAQHLTYRIAKEK